jgi:protein-S-isoprenylcysteine O-methyltransferase Ste14
MSPESAGVVLWVVWYVTWIGAVVWSGKTRVQMRTDACGLHRALTGVGVVLLFLPAHVAGPAFGGWATRKLWSEPAWAAWGLLALTAAGFGFCWWARRHLGRLWSGYVTLKEDHHVVDTGPYGLVRHPIYAGAMFAALMTALMRASPAGLAGTALIAAGFSMTARIEERFLREQLGAEAYDAYSARVPMLFPRFG